MDKMIVLIMVITLATLGCAKNEEQQLI